ncbi:MAG: Fe-S cluster assembly protein SufD [Verrucomicrobiales bacterium]|nr:Fe-S cluster assembly protein SufD [Verrucomicrobiales bacterium]
MSAVAPATVRPVEPATEVDPWVQPFARLESGALFPQQPAWVFPLRKAGLARFAELGLPTLAHEDWRFTNVAPLKGLPFAPTLAAPTQRLADGELDARPFARLPGDRLVFLDGHFVPGLSRVGTASGGGVVTSLAAAFRTHAGLLERHLTRYAHGSANPFTALNDAYFTDGALIHVPAGRVIEHPVQLVFVASGEEEGRAQHVRNLILAEAGSQFTVVEHYLGRGTATTVTNAVTEVVAADQVVMDHLKFQDESRAAYHFAAVHADLGRASQVNLHSFALGSRVSRHNIHTALNGEGLECVLNGLYLTDGDQLADHYMVVEHAQPHTASHEYFNGILEGRSRGVFHGRILVRPGAQKTDAKQTNKNLLLSDDATVNTKPQLEIYADDVKCTHGATVGQLPPEQIFYLRSRGLPLETARRMLIHAFAGEIIDRVRCAPLREELDRLVWDRLEQDTQIQVGPHA